MAYCANRSQPDLDRAAAVACTSAAVLHVHPVETCEDLTMACCKRRTPVRLARRRTGVVRLARDAAAAPLSAMSRSTSGTGYAWSTASRLPSALICGCVDQNYREMPAARQSTFSVFFHSA